MNRSINKNKNTQKITNILSSTIGSVSEKRHMDFFIFMCLYYSVIRFYQFKLYLN